MTGPERSRAPVRTPGKRLEALAAATPGQSEMSACIREAGSPPLSSRTDPTVATSRAGMARLSGRPTLTRPHPTASGTLIPCRCPYCHGYSRQTFAHTLRQGPDGRRKFRRTIVRPANPRQVRNPHSDGVGGKQMAGPPPGGEETARPVHNPTSRDKARRRVGRRDPARSRLAHTTRRHPRVEASVTPRFVLEAGTLPHALLIFFEEALRPFEGIADELLASVPRGGLGETDLARSPPVV